MRWLKLQLPIPKYLGKLDNIEFHSHPKMLFNLPKCTPQTSVMKN